MNKWNPSSKTEAGLASMYYMACFSSRQYDELQAAWMTSFIPKMTVDNAKNGLDENANNYIIHPETEEKVQEVRDRLGTLMRYIAENCSHAEKRLFAVRMYKVLVPDPDNFQRRDQEMFADVVLSIGLDLQGTIEHVLKEVRRRGWGQATPTT